MEFQDGSRTVLSLDRSSPCIELSPCRLDAVVSPEHPGSGRPSGDVTFYVKPSDGRNFRFNVQLVQGNGCGGSCASWFGYLFGANLIDVFFTAEPGIPFQGWPNPYSASDSERVWVHANDKMALKDVKLSEDLTEKALATLDHTTKPELERELKTTNTYITSAMQSLPTSQAVLPLDDGQLGTADKALATAHEDVTEMQMKVQEDTTFVPAEYAPELTNPDNEEQIAAGVM